MTGFRCGCGPAIDCTYPKCKEGVEMSQSITQMLRDYARDHTTTTYHDALIRKAATEIEFHEERWDQLRQQLAALRDHQVAYETETEQQLASRDAEIERLKTVPMRYRRMAFNAQLQDENAQLSQQLADSQKQVTLLREAMQGVWKDGYCFVGPEGQTDEQKAFEQALAATDDMSQYILCEKDPVAWENSELYPEIVDHQRRTTDEPLYRAATAPKEE